MKITHLLFFLLCFFVSYSEALKTELGPVEISVPYFLALAGLAFMLIGRLKGGVPLREWQLKVYTPAVVFFVAYIIISIIALLSSQMDAAAYTADSLFRIIEQAGRLFLSLCIMIFVSMIVRTEEVMTRGLKVVAVSAGFVGIYGIYQVLGTMWGFYRPLIPHTGAYGVIGGATRAIGMMQEPSYLAGFLCFSIVTTAMLLVGDGLASGRFRVAVWLSLGLQGLCLILTTSTVGFIGMTMAILAACFVLKGRPRRRLIPILVVVAVLVTIPVVYIAARSNLMDKLIVATVDKPTHESANERTGFVKAAIGMFLDYPIIGVGPGMYDNFARDYAPEFSTARVLIPNNVYAELLSETGLLGFISFMVMLGGLFFKAVGKMRAFGRHNTLHAGLVITFVALAVEFMAYPTFKMEFIWFLFGLSAAVISSPGVKHQVESEK